MTQNECIDDIIKQLSGRNTQIINNPDFIPLYKDTVEMLKQRGIIEQVGNTYSRKLTNRGYEFKDSGLPFDEWIKPKPVIPTVNHGNIIGGNVHGSNFNIDSPTNPITENKKISLLEKLSWIAGIIGVLITIYEMFIKSHLKWIP